MATTDEEERHRGGRDGGGVEGYLWMRRRAVAVGGCDKKGGGGGEGWGSNAKAEMVCRVLLEYFARQLGEASKIWEVVRKSLGSC